MVGKFVGMILIVAGVGYAMIRSEHSDAPDPAPESEAQPVAHDVERVPKLLTSRRPHIQQASVDIVQPQAEVERSTTTEASVVKVAVERAPSPEKVEPRQEVLRKMPIESLPVSKEFLELLQNEEIPGSRTLAMTRASSGAVSASTTPAPKSENALDPFSYRLISFKPGKTKSGADIRENVDLNLIQAFVLGPPDFSLATKEANLTHLLSLGNGGEVTFEIVGGYLYDGPGPDLVVFENPFIIGGTNGKEVYAETATVSIAETNEDESYRTFPCQKEKAPYPGCAGVVPVRYHASLSLDQVGGDLFDLEKLGVTRARFIRIRDTGDNANSMLEGTEGFDLDAIGLMNAEKD